MKFYSKLVDIDLGDGAYVQFSDKMSAEMRQDLLGKERLSELEFIEKYCKGISGVSFDDTPITLETIRKCPFDLVQTILNKYADYIKSSVLGQAEKN